MITRTLKLRPTVSQQNELDRWLWHLTAVWNWGLRKIELASKDSIYYGLREFQNQLPGHGRKLGIANHVLGAVLIDVYQGWQRCFRGVSRRPRLKGQRNRMSSIPFPDVLPQPDNNYIRLPVLGQIRFHKQELPPGKIKCGRVVKRASGWYLCLFIDAEPNHIPATGNGEIGIDPGFSTLATLSTGERVEHPNELKKSASRLAQAQRGKNRKLTARIKEREANQRKDRNHKLSRRLVAENETICWSKDSHRAIAKTFGKSVASASHGQLREMIAYKCTASGRQFIEVPSKNSTKTCSACGALTGPTGYAGLSVRQWECAVCGATHDRDVNAAINTLHAGLGLSHERRREATSEKARRTPRSLEVREL